MIADPCPSTTEAQLRAQLAVVKAENAKLKAFANDILERVFDASLDGPDAQEDALKHGLLEPVMMTVACGHFCLCAEVGFPIECQRKTSFLALPAPDHAAEEKA